jgi:hypothetical protein
LTSPPDRGDVATTVEYYEGDGAENGYDLEVFNVLERRMARVIAP